MMLPQQSSSATEAITDWFDMRLRAHCSAIVGSDWLFWELQIMTLNGRPLTPPSALTAFVESRVASYKTIRQWEMVGSVPRTPSGKLLR